MALTRKSLKAFGLTEEQVDSIIEMHTETVDGLKADINKYKADAEKLPGVQKKLDELEAAGDGGYKEKYEKEHKAFEDFKTEQTAKETRAAKEKAYRELLISAGISEKRVDTVLKVSDMEKIELEDGKIKGADELTKTIKTEWADFIVNTRTEGANVHNPPANNTNTGKGDKTRAEILAIRDGVERRRLMKDNPDLFPELNIKTDE